LRLGRQLGLLNWLGLGRQLGLEGSLDKIGGVYEAIY